MSKQLTEQQIENYRKVLINVFGPYALIMPIEQIQAYRNKIQGMVNQIDKENEK